MSDSGGSPQTATRTREATPPPPEPPAPRSHSLRLFLVRHGQSTWNETGRIQGQHDPPLSRRGEDQADRLAAHLQDRDWVGFYCSDLRRAWGTALPLARRIGRQPEARSDLREIDLGEWEGLDPETVQERYPEPWAAWNREPSYDLIPGGEGAAAFEARVGAFVSEVLARFESGDVLAVTHGGVIQVALGLVTGRASHGFFPFRTDNCSISILQRSRERLVIAAVNDVCHLG